MYIIEIPTEHNLKDKKEINVCYELPYFKYRLYTLQMDSLKKRNISGAYQPFLANCANFNLGYRINIQGAWGHWIILQLTVHPKSHFCKSPSHSPCVPLACWSGGPNWCLPSLHEEIGLHLICSLKKYLQWLYKSQIVYI